MRRTVEGRVRGVCPECGWIAFGNAKPCVGALIERDGQLLLVRRERAPFKGWWDIPDTYALNLYYRAHVTGGHERAGDDAAALRWFGPEELPRRIAFGGHAREVLRDWRRGRPVRR